MTRLSLLELDVLAGAAHGETVKETATRLHRAVGTVKHHRAAVIDKLDARNVTAAVHIAHELGLLGERPDAGDLKLTDGQLRAFHAKCSDLDVRDELERRTTKRRMLEEASRRFGRLIESANDLRRHEANELLELLEHELDAGTTETTVESRVAGAPA